MRREVALPVLWLQTRPVASLGRRIERALQAGDGFGGRGGGVRAPEMDSTTSICLRIFDFYYFPLFLLVLKGIYHYILEIGLLFPGVLTKWKTRAVLFGFDSVPTRSGGRWYGL